MVNETTLGLLVTTGEVPVDATTRQRCVRRIRDYVSRQPEQVRRELARRTNWCWGAERKGGNLCLIAQVADIRARNGLPQEEFPTVYQEFDRLAGAIGLPAVVALVQDAAGYLK